MPEVELALRDFQPWSAVGRPAECNSAIQQITNLRYACAVCRTDLHIVDGELLWQERSVCSVANLTRKDGEEFLALAPRVPVRTTIPTFALAQANEALQRLRGGQIEGAAVLVPG